MRLGSVKPHGYLAQNIEGVAFLLWWVHLSILNLIFEKNKKNYILII